MGTNGKREALVLSSFSSTKRKNEKKESTKDKIEREKKKTNKIINASATITVHICTVTVVILHKYTILHQLIWVFFCSKCVK